MTLRVAVTRREGGTVLVDAEGRDGETVATPAEDDGNVTVAVSSRVRAPEPPPVTVIISWTDYEGTRHSVERSGLGTHYIAGPRPDGVHRTYAVTLTDVR